MKFTQEMMTELKAALKDSSLSRYHRRIQAVYFRAQGKTNNEIKELLDLSHDTVWRLVKKYEKEGLSALTTDKRGGRNRFYLTFEEEQAFLKEQLETAASGEYVTTTKLYDAYQKLVGRSTTREGFYALLKRHGWRKVTPRPEHPKKADAQVIEASKNKI